MSKGRINSTISTKKGVLRNKQKRMRKSIIFSIYSGKATATFKYQPNSSQRKLHLGMLRPTKKTGSQIHNTMKKKKKQKK